MYKFITSSGRRKWGWGGGIWLNTSGQDLPFLDPLDTGSSISFAALSTKIDTTFTLLNMTLET
jgi:hypothetical protein